MSYGPEILQGNKTIALFMGYPENEIQAEEWCGCNVFDEVFAGHKEMISAEYHEQWGRLMPVVEKIEKGLFAVEIKENGCSITGYRKYEGVNFLVKEALINKITATYQCVLKFLTWYNMNHKS